MVCRTNGNGKNTCGQPPAFLNACAQQGNLFAKVLARYWREHLPRFVPFDGSVATILGVRELGTNGRHVALSILPKMFNDRFGSLTRPQTTIIPALGNITVNLNTLFPLVSEIAAFFRVTFVQNVVDQAVTITRTTQTEDTTAAVPKQDQIIVTLSPSGCNSNDRVQMLGMIFNGVNKGGAGVVVPTVKIFGPTIQTSGAFIPNGQTNTHEDNYAGPVNTGVQTDSINESHAWTCELLYNGDRLVAEDDDGAFISGDDYNTIKTVQEAVREEVTKAVMNGNGNGNGGVSRIPEITGFPTNGNGVKNGNGTRVHVSNGTKNGSSLPPVWNPRNVNGANGNGKVYSYPTMAPAPMPVFAPVPQMPVMPQLNPYGQYGVYYPHTGVPVPVQFPYPLQQSRQ